MNQLNQNLVCDYCEEPQKDRNAYHNHLVKKHLFEEFPCKFWECELVRDKKHNVIGKKHHEKCPMRNEKTKAEYSKRVWGN